MDLIEKVANLYTKSECGVIFPNEEKCGFCIRLKNGKCQKAEELAQQIDQLYKEHYASLTPEGLREYISDLVCACAVIDCKECSERDRCNPNRCIEGLKVTSLVLAKFQHYLEAEREKAREDTAREIIEIYNDWCGMPETKFKRKWHDGGEFRAIIKTRYGIK